MRGEVHNPYNGILAFLLLPVLFFLGLILIPLGILLAEQNERTGAGCIRPSFPPLNLKNRGIPAAADVRRRDHVCEHRDRQPVGLWRGVLHGDGFVLRADLPHGDAAGVHRLSELAAFARGVRASATSVPGESWFVRSKLSGIRQVFAVTFHTYDTPIPAPVRNLRPARETCEACHWPQKYGEDRLVVINKFGDDEKNSLAKTVLLLKIGGGNKGIGIHGTHLGPGVRIRYGHSDEAAPDDSVDRVQRAGRQDRVPGGGRGGGRQGFVDARDGLHGLPQPAVPQLTSCRNGPWTRPCSRAISRPPAIRQEEERGDSCRKTMPAGTTAADADSGGPGSVSIATLSRHLRRSARRQWSSTARNLLAIYNRNVFPEMKVTWGIYPNNIGHTDFPGCFRCHDDSHASADGRKVTQDCGACHSLLAMEEAAPKILTDLGVVESKEQK